MTVNIASNEPNSVLSGTPGHGDYYLELLLSGLHRHEDDKIYFDSSNTIFIIKKQQRYLGALHHPGASALPFQSLGVGKRRGEKAQRYRIASGHK